MHISLTKPGGIIMLVPGVLLAACAHAFDLGDMMSPSSWLGSSGDENYYDGYYGGPAYGYSGNLAPGYGGLPGFGYGGFPDQYYGGIPGYGGLPDLGGDPLLGYGGSPLYGGYGSNPGGYGYPATPRQNSTETAAAAEIKRLKERIRKLEENCAQTQPAWSGQPAYPAAPWGGQAGTATTGNPWGEQPAYPATNNPWSQQPSTPAATSPWSGQQWPQQR